MAIPMSQEYKDAFLNNTPQDIRLTFLVDPSIDIRYVVKNDGIVQGSLSIDRGCVANNDIEIGNVSSAEMTVTLSSIPTHSLEGKEVNVAIKPRGTADIETNWVSMGTFIVDEIHKTKSTMSLICLDKMVGLDNPIDRTLFTNSLTPLEIITLIADTLGLSVGDSPQLRNESIYLNPLLMDENATYRDLLSRTLEVGCANAFLFDDEIYVRWYKQATQGTVTEENRFNSDLQGYAVEITGVEVVDGDTSYMNGQEGYVIQITDNPLVTSDNVATVINGIVTRLIGFTYQPYTAEILPMPYLLPLDRISFVKDGTTYSTIVTNVVYSANSNMRIAGKGESPLAKGYAKKSMTREQANNMKAVEERARLYALTEVEKVSNYFWHDSSGAHVSNAPRDTTGYNTLITANALQLRDGTKPYLSLTSDSTSPYVLIGRTKDDNNEDSRNIILRDKSIYMRTGTTADIRLAYDSTENMPFVTIGRTGTGNRNVLITPLGMSIRTNLTKDARFEYDSTNDTPIIVLGRTGANEYNMYLANNTLQLRKGTTVGLELTTDNNTQSASYGKAEIVLGTSSTGQTSITPNWVSMKNVYLFGETNRAGLEFCGFAYNLHVYNENNVTSVIEWVGDADPNITDTQKEEIYATIKGSPIHPSGSIRKSITGGFQMFNTDISLSTVLPTPTVTIGWNGELTAKGCNFTSNKALTITRTENTYVNATSIGRLYAYERSGFLWLNGNFQITTAMPTSSDFIEIAQISGWSTARGCFATIPTQNGTGCVTVQITPRGSVQIYNGTSGNISGFARMSMSAPKS